MNENQNVNGAPQVNSVPNVQPQVQMTNPVPPKKSPVGLIIGIIIGLAVLIGGGLALFFLVIKPNFIDGGSSNGEDEKEETTWADTYNKYLKKNVEDDLYVAFLDMDEDGTPEMLIRDDYGYIESLSTIEKDKVVTLDISKSGNVDYVYSIEDEKAEWYLVVGSYYHDYYNLSESLKGGLEKLGDYDSYSISEAAKKYVSLEADIDYKEIDEDSYSKVVKEAYKSKDNGYKLGKTVKEVKEELEEKNRAKNLSCTQSVDTDGYDAHLDYVLKFERNELDVIDVVVVVDFTNSSSTTDTDATIEQIKKNYENMGFSPKVVKKSDKVSNIEFTINKSKFSLFFDDQYDEDKLDYDSVYDLLKQQSNFTCTAD